MGKFINTDRKMTIDALVDGTKERLNNPYYKFNNKPATIVTYYNMDVKQATVDEGLGVTYSNTGENSSLRFNKIDNMFLFGIEPMKLNLSESDFGIETEGAEGEAYILPNTIIPYPGDYFKINHTNHPYLFRVTGVDIDTLDDGANAYSIKYELNRYNESDIESQIVDDYSFIIDNVGTEMNPVLRNNDYKLIEELDNILVSLKKYYEDLFFDSKVQTFIYFYQNRRVYDPYLIEFLIRNKLLRGNERYIYVTHQTHLPKTFSMDYDRTVFRSIELKETDNLNNNNAISTLECDPNSLLTQRFEEYYSITYNKGFFGGIPIEILPSAVVRKIREGSKEYFTISDPFAIYNILIQYLLDDEIQIKTVIDIVQRIHYCENKELYYGIPITIYIIEYYIKNLLKAKNVTYN